MTVYLARFVYVTYQMRWFLNRTRMLGESSPSQLLRPKRKTLKVAKRPPVF